jgi:hypothetical protein
MQPFLKNKKIFPVPSLAVVFFFYSLDRKLTNSKIKKIVLCLGLKPESRGAEF